MWYSIATVGPLRMEHFLHLINWKSCKMGTTCYETSKEKWEWMYSIFSFTHQRKPPPIVVCTPNWRGIKIRILCTTPHLSTHTWIWDLYLYTMMLVLFDMVIKNTQVIVFQPVNTGIILIPSDIAFPLVITSVTSYPCQRPNDILCDLLVFPQMYDTSAFKKP